MSVVRKNEESLVETDKLKANAQSTKEQQSLKSESKKKGFLFSTLEEVKKVDWPKAKYTLGWSGIVILFAITLSVFITFFDSVFESTVKYTTCTSEAVKSDRNNKDGEFNLGSEIKSCSSDYLDNLLYREEDTIQESEAVIQTK